MKCINKTILGFVFAVLLVVLSVAPMTGCGGGSGVEISKDQAV